MLSVLSLQPLPVSGPLLMRRPQGGASAASGGCAPSSTAPGTGQAASCRLGSLGTPRAAQPCSVPWKGGCHLQREPVGAGSPAHLILPCHSSRFGRLCSTSPFRVPGLWLTAQFGVLGGTQEDRRPHPTPVTHSLLCDLLQGFCGGEPLLAGGERAVATQAGSPQTPGLLFTQQQPAGQPQAA